MQTVKYGIEKRIVLAVLIVAFTEGLMRIAFALLGYDVGRLAPAWMYFKPVDTLVVKQEYYMDELGIYRARSDFWMQNHYHINCEGFRGREFVPATQDSSSLSVLFIGDSFTWGAHCDSTFCDILDRKPGLICYNTGIPGNDPPQYENVARHYVPLLKPDYTILMFFLGNDLMDMPRQVVPRADLYYQTNAGWLPTSYKGRHFNSAQEAYDFIARDYTVSSPWEKLLLQTATGTAILALPLRIKEYAQWKRRAGSTVANEYLRSIRAICEPDSKLLIFIIPSLQQDLQSRFYKNPAAYVKRHYPRLISGLEDITYVLPLRKEHYWPLPDGHFNYQGHSAVAAFIESTLTHNPDI